MALPRQEEVTGTTPRVAYVSLGCRVNRVETDAVAAELRDAGCEVVGEREAHVVVVNTCAVTGEAEAKARKAVRHALGMPLRPTVVVTGCAASLFPQRFQELGPGVVVEPEKGRVARRALDELRVSGLLVGDDAARAEGQGGVTPTGRTRPGIKVQDGCDLRCTYCIVWKARGRSRSIAADEVVRQVRAACAQGAPEVMLTGINLGRWRENRPGGALGLPDLLEEVLGRTDVGRVRLGSIEPQDVDGRLVRVMAASGGRVAPFLHMCLQSGCDRTLGRMGRVYDTRLFAERVGLARETLPNVAFGTDLIVGFPGETEDDWAGSLAFCEAARFSRMHVFRFSPRPGTPAATMEAQVSPLVAARRAHEAHELAGRLRLAEARRLAGQPDLVAVQGRGKGVTGGLFDAEVDPMLEVGSLVPVVVTGARDDATLVTEAPALP